MARRELMVRRQYKPEPEACSRALKKLLEAKTVGLGITDGHDDVTEERSDENVARRSIYPTGT